MGDNLRLRLQLELDDKLAKAQTKAFEAKNVVQLNTIFKFNDTDFQASFNKLRAQIGDKAKIDIFGDKSGDAVRAIATFTDGVGKAKVETYSLIKATATIPEHWENTSTKVSNNYVAAVKAAEKEQEKLNNLTEQKKILDAKIADQAIKDAARESRINTQTVLKYNKEKEESLVRQRKELDGISQRMQEIYLRGNNSSNRSGAWEIVEEKNREAGAISGNASWAISTKNIDDAKEYLSQLREIELYIKRLTIVAKQQDDILEKETKEKEKQLNIMEAQVQKAKEFLEWSKKRNQTADMREAQGIASQILTEKDPKVVAEMTNRLKELEAGLHGASSANLSFGEGMRRAITTIGEYALSTGLLYGAFNQLKQGMQYIIELNKEMTNIQVLQVEGARTKEEIDSLAKSYNNLAKELGATTIEVSKASVEWLRQGKTIEETKELLRSSMMLSKLGALESAEATDYLTAILNGYKLEAKDASRVVDQLISVDNVAATSAGKQFARIYGNV